MRRYSCSNCGREISPCLKAKEHSPTHCPYCGVYLKGLYEAAWYEHNQYIFSVAGLVAIFLGLFAGYFLAEFIGVKGDRFWWAIFLGSLPGLCIFILIAYVWDMLTRREEHCPLPSPTTFWRRVYVIAGFLVVAIALLLVYIIAQLGYLKVGLLVGLTTGSLLLLCIVRSIRNEQKKSS